MSQPKPTSAAFLTLTALVVIAAAAGVAVSWPHVQNAAKNQSSKLVGEARSASAAEAMADYRLAVRLDPSNLAAQLGLARTQIKAGQAEAALVTLKSAGEGSETTSLRVRTLIELGRAAEAADLASMLPDSVLAALAYALAGRPADITALIPRLSSPEAAQSIARIQAGTLPLAAQLYAAGLPDSSSALLLKQPASFTRNVLLAHIAIDRHTAADLISASDYLAVAVAINPSDADAHRLYAGVLADRGLTEESAQQTKLAERIQAGRP